MGRAGLKDERLVVPLARGTEGRVARNVYGSGNEQVPGGFSPKGASGRIANSYLCLPQILE